MPHARSAHQPRTASKAVNIAAKKRSMLKRREKGITASATAPNINARAPRARLPSLCKLGANSLFMNLFDIAPQVSTVATSQARQCFRVPTISASHLSSIVRLSRTTEEARQRSRVPTGSSVFPLREISIGVNSWSLFASIRVHSRVGLFSRPFVVRF
jgi:hypothetical protein